LLYETVIGLEVHAELLTQSKLFCGCANKFGEPPNTLVCPVCLGLPGVLPVINKKAVDYLLKAALALGCRVAPYSKFDRKNYFYPDMPKNYQISQYDLPLAEEGSLDIAAKAGLKTIRIKRIHLEEDTGKSVHLGTIDDSLYTKEDYNRAGVPLLEIVTHPDITAPEEAHAYLTALKQLLQWLEISDCKMEEGSLRCDANISLRPIGESALGVKTEIKNMNSFKSVQAALTFEVGRQSKLLQQGNPIIQETRGWDENRQETFPMRSKEEVQDYRYFPEPDLPPLTITAPELESLSRELPELPEAMRRRFKEQYRLSPYDAAQMTQSKAWAAFFEATAQIYPNAKAVANWMMVEVAKYLNTNQVELSQTLLTPVNLAEMLKLIDQGTLSGKLAKDVLPEIFTTGKAVFSLIKEQGLEQLSNESALSAIIREVLLTHQVVVEDYKNGKDKAFGFLMGQVMRATQGKANPELTQRLLKEAINGA
jgi:aspartyl-tRNA(Asn)/glutamyl-tRNA(Gln) amidotransferase subunit B